MRKIFDLFIVLSLFVACISCNKYEIPDEVVSEIDSLNSLSYRLRYKDLSRATEVANQAYLLASPDYSEFPQVLNNMGFCAYMAMDFEKSMSLFSKVIISETISNSSITCLVLVVAPPHTPHVWLLICRFF